MSELISSKIKIKKRVFLGLLLVALLFLLLASFYLLIVASSRYAAYLRSIFVVFIFSTLIFTLLFLFGLLAIVLTLLQKRTLPFPRWFMEKTLLLLYPFVLQIGRFTHIAQERIQRSFIEVNNQLIYARAFNVKAGELLLLLPHCLQNDGCSYKITRNAENCRRCGKCQLPEILEISSRSGIKVRVVSGGTLARRALKEYGPRAVVAVACERDLSSGINYSFTLPGVGVLNESPMDPVLIPG